MIRKYFIMQTIEGIAYENGKNLPTLKTDAIKKGNDYSIMIHSGLSRLQITRRWYYQKYRDAG
jgi:hypothetical protein